MSYSDRDLIVAPATATQLRAPLAVIRLSGPGSWEAVKPWFHPRRDAPWRPWRARYGTWRDDQGIVDEVVVLPFAAPHSYTGQEMVEILCHGNPLFVGAILDSCSRSGARLARPGEFTQRAFLNGKKDLHEAEAVHALIEAKTRYQAAIIRRQSHGALARTVQHAVDEILSVQAHLEAAIDYAEEDVDPVEAGSLGRRLHAVIERLERLRQAAAFAQGMRRGFRVLLTGRPNVGKSTLFNALLAQERAIVTDEPGTTRDFITEEVEMGGLPVVLIDTAGVGDAADPVEEMGIGKVMELLGTVDLVLYLTPGAEPHPPYSELTELAAERWMTVFTKGDQGPGASEDGLTVCAKKMHGLEELRDEIVVRLSAAHQGQTEMWINQRQEHALTEAVELLERAERDHREGFGDEILSTYLNHVRRKLGEITGETTVEDILDRMFSTFCLGK